MRAAFHDVSPCRTITTSVKSSYSSAPEAGDDIPKAASGAWTQRICGKFAGPGGRKAATAEAGEGRKAAKDAIDGVGGVGSGGSSVLVGRRQSISGAQGAQADLISYFFSTSRAEHGVIRWFRWAPFVRRLGWLGWAVICYAEAEPIFCRRRPD